MDSNLPKPPIYLRLYYLFRSSLCPQYTAFYILIQSIVFGILTSIIIVYLFDLIPRIIIPYLFTYLFIGLIPFIFVEYEMWDSSIKVMRISNFIYLSAAGIGVLVIILLNYNSELTELTILSTSMITIYIASILKISRKYKGDRDYYTNDNTDVNDKWRRASIALEKSSKNSGRQSYYWAKKAQHIYNKISESDDVRYMPKKGAEMLEKSSEIISILSFVENERFVLYRSKANAYIKKSDEFFSKRICDNCGLQKDVSDCQFQTDRNKKYIYCNNCRNAYKQKQKRQRRKSYRKKQNKSQKSTNKKGEQKQNKNSSRKDEPRDKMSVKEAKEILDISDLNDKDKIKKAFRKKVKEKHPDKGGSSEEFIKVKEAKEVLMNK